MRGRYRVSYPWHLADQGGARLGLPMLNRRPPWSENSFAGRYAWNVDPGPPGERIVSSVRCRWHIPTPPCSAPSLAGRIAPISRRKGGRIPTIRRAIRRFRGGGRATDRKRGASTWSHTYQHAITRVPSTAAYRSLRGP